MREDSLLQSVLSAAWMQSLGELWFSLGFHAAGKDSFSGSLNLPCRCNVCRKLGRALSEAEITPILDFE